MYLQSRLAGRILGLAPLALLAASVLLTAALGWQALRTAASHRALAEQVLRDYAEVAAAEFSRRATTFVGHYGIAVVSRALVDAAQKAGVPSRDALLAAMPPQSARAIELVGAVFAFDTTRASFESAHPVPPAAIRAALIERARGADQLVHVSDARERTRVYIAVPVPGRGPASWVGFELSIAAVSRWLSEHAGSEPLLPPALAARGAGPSALQVTVAAPDAQPILRIAQQGGERAPLAVRELGAVPAMAALSGFEVQVSIDPAAASALVIGGLPASQAGLLFGLMALSAALAGAAGLQLRRERRDAWMRRDFVTRASHELRTPVARIRMFTETLLLDRVRSPAERRQTLEALDRGARRLSILVDNVLGMSAERRAPALYREPVDVEELVRETVREFESGVVAGAGTEVRSPAGLRAVLDPQALRQVLVNLLDNAWKYGGSPPAVRVELELAHGELRLAVEDGGPGVPAGERQRIWEPYVRLDRDRRSAVSGTGIGLAVVRDLVTLHGGRSRVEQAGRGARFVVTFPQPDAGGQRA